MTAAAFDLSALDKALSTCGKTSCSPGSKDPNDHVEVPLDIIALNDALDLTSRLSCRLVCRQWRKIDAQAVEATPTYLDPKLPRLFPMLASLRLKRCAGVDDKSLADVLAACPALVSLEMDLPGFAEHLKSAAFLAQATQLRRVAISNCFFLEPSSLSHLAHLKYLTELRLAGVALTDAEAQHVCGAARLERLVLNTCCGLGTAGVQALVRGLPNLTHLDVGYCSRIDTDGVVALAGLTRLTSLVVDGLRRVQPAGIAALGRLKALRSLSIQSMPGLTLPLLRDLLGCWHLRRLSLSVPGLTTVAAAQTLGEVLSRQPALEHLCLEALSQGVRWPTLAIVVETDPGAIPSLDFSQHTCLRELRLVSGATPLFVPLSSALGTLPCLEVFRDEGDGGSSLASPHTWEPVYAHVTTLRSIVAVAREVPGAQGASDLASLSRLSQLTALDVNANRTRALRDLADAPASLRTLRVANAVLGDVLELSALARLTGLTSLTLDGVGGPGGGPASAALSVLTALTGLRELRVLHFLGDVATEVCDSDGGLQCPARLVVPGGIVGALPSLERVQMVGCGASRGLLRDLGRARCLASVDLTGCALVDEGGAGEGDAPLPCAGPAVPLAGCGVLDEFVRAQQGGTGAVRHLVLAKCMGLCQEDIVALSRLPSLSTLDVTATGHDGCSRAICAAFAPWVQVQVQAPRDSWSQA